MALLRIEPNIVDSDGNFTFNNVVATSNVSAAGYYWANGVALTTSLSFANASIATLDANVGAYQIYANTGIAALNANIGAYQIWSNTDSASQTSSFNTLYANVGTYQIWANANAASQQTQIDTINANVGAYQIWANANATTQAASIDTINANIGSYQTYANTVIYSNANASAYLAATYPIVNDGALRIGSATGPDIYLDALNTIYVNHGGSNHTNLVVDAHASFSGNTTFSSNTTVTGAGNLTVNGLSNITVKSGGAIHLLSGAYLYGYDAFFSNVTAGNTTVGNISATGFYFANGTPFVSSTYGNTDVAAYLLVNSTITGLQSNAAFQANLLDVLTGNAATQGSLLDVLVANAAVQAANLTILLSNAAAQEASLTSLVSNAAVQSGAIDSINANVGAYQIYSNANAASQSVSINNINANVGAYQIWANANAATQATGIDVINANVGAYQLYANSNSATQQTSIDSINANVGAYETWANAQIALKANINSPSFTGNISAGNVSATGYYFANGAPFASSNYGNVDVAGYLAPYYTYANANAATQATGIDTINANLGAYQTYANANAATQATAIDTLQTQVYSNVNTSAYLAGNITTGNITTNGIFYANGAPYGNIAVRDEGTLIADRISSINFVGSGVSAIATGSNVTVTVTGGGGGGGASLVFTASSAPLPSGNNPGDQWYNTTTDTLYEYVYDGVAYYWVDIQTPVTGNVSTGYVNRKYTATGSANTYAISTGCNVYNVLVYLNGVAQMPTDDYTITGTTLTVDGMPDAGTIVQIRELPR